MFCAEFIVCNAKSLYFYIYGIYRYIYGINVFDIVGKSVKNAKVP